MPDVMNSCGPRQLPIDDWAEQFDIPLEGCVEVEISSDHIVFTQENDEGSKLKFEVEQDGSVYLTIDHGERWTFNAPDPMRSSYFSYLAELYDAGGSGLSDGLSDSILGSFYCFIL